MSGVRVGIIGTGGIAQGHVRRLLANPDAEVSALCDIRPEAMAKTVERNPTVAGVPLKRALGELSNTAIRPPES